MIVILAAGGDPRMTIGRITVAAQASRIYGNNHGSAFHLLTVTPANAYAMPWGLVHGPPRSRGVTMEAG
jgi:hypothetical protein